MMSMILLGGCWIGAAGSTLPSPPLRHSPGRSLDVALEPGERVALDNLHPIGFIIWGIEPAVPVIEESPLAVHQPVERGRVRLSFKEVDAAVSNSRGVAAFEPVLFEDDAGGVHPSEEDPIDGQGHLSEPDRSACFTQDSTRFNLPNGALDHQIGCSDHLRKALEAEHFHGAFTTGRRPIRLTCGVDLMIATTVSRTGRPSLQDRKVMRERGGSLAQLTRNNPAS